MAEDDDRVHEGVQVAAMTGAAAAARTAETLLRGQQDRRHRDYRQPDRAGQPSRPDRSMSLEMSPEANPNTQQPDQRQPATEPMLALTDDLVVDVLLARQITDQMNPVPAADATRTSPAKTTASASYRLPQHQRRTGVSR